MGLGYYKGKKKTAIEGKPKYHRGPWILKMNKNLELKKSTIAVVGPGFKK